MSEWRRSSATACAPSPLAGAGARVEGLQLADGRLVLKIEHERLAVRLRIASGRPFGREDRLLLDPDFDLPLQMRLCCVGDIRQAAGRQAPLDGWGSGKEDNELPIALGGLRAGRSERRAGGRLAVRPGVTAGAAAQDAGESDGRRLTRGVRRQSGTASAPGPAIDALRRSLTNQSPESRQSPLAAPPAPDESGTAIRPCRAGRAICFDRSGRGGPGLGIQDKGIDVVATFRVAGTFLVIVGVQAKHYRPEPPVGACVVQQLIRGIDEGEEDVTHGMVITSRHHLAGSSRGSEGIHWKHRRHDRPHRW